MKKTRNLFEEGKYCLKISKIPLFDTLQTSHLIKIGYLSCLLFISAFAFANPLDINLNKQSITIQEALKEIERQSKYKFIFSLNHLDLTPKRTLNLKNVTIEMALKELFEGAPIQYKIQGRQIILTKSTELSVPNSKTNLEETSKRTTHSNIDRLIKGKVVSEEGENLLGVSIIVKGTNVGTSTDLEGNFILNLPDQANTLVLSYIGFLSKEVVVLNQSQLEIVLQEDKKTLEEVVVVGYGTQKKVNLSGSVDHITAKAISALQVNTMGEALQGQLPGVYVNTADGKPGRASGFNIRGNTSINGGGPLIVIDGIPQTDADLNNISPHDIEGISVLKDAASTAIYGARASFGVILVTTKRGQKGKVKVQYNNYFAASRATRVPDVYDNPLDYLEINEREFNGNIGQTYYTDAQVAYPRQVATDPSLPHAKLENIGGRSNLLLGGKVYNYYEEWLRKYTPKQNHRLNISGGDDRLQYYISGDFNHEEGAIKFKPENINRYTLRSNLSYKLRPNITFFNYTSMVKRAEDQPNQYLYGFTSNVYRFIENSNPMMPEYVEVGEKMVPTDIGFYREFLEKKSGIEQNSHDTKTTFGADLDFLQKALKVHVDYTYQFKNTDYLRWWDNKGPYISNSFNNRNIILDAYTDAGPPKIMRNNWREITNNINAYTSYTKSIAKNNFSIMAGYNQEMYDYLRVNASHEYPLDVPQNSLNLATGTSVVSDNDIRFSSRSVFSRFNYDFNEKYLFEVNGSYFLSSKFAKENRGHTFLAASGAWRISEEKFFTPLKSAIDNLKIRASYGAIGNSDIGAYDYIPIMSVGQSAYTLEGTRVNTTYSPAPRSANFTWETVKTINGGLDVAAFNNRLSASLDIYQRRTLNMLANYRSLPSVFGASVPKENIAAMKTNGWELNIGWNDRKKLGNDNLSYGIRFNLSDYSSTITDYYNPTNYLGDYYEGQKLGEIWGLTTMGYFKTDEEAKKGALLDVSPIKAYASAGTIKFDDVNGDGVISHSSRTLADPGDYKIIGNTTPRYQYGITLNASWKGFDFNSFLMGVGKKDIYPGSEAVNFWGPYNRKYQVMLKHTIAERWTPDNTDAYFPKPQGYLALGTRDLGQAQTKYLQDASFLRLKNLTIGYTLPKTWVNKAKLDHVRMYVSGQNLWETTKLHFSLDPEGLAKDPDANSGDVGIGTAYPIQRVYALGLEIRF